jgi:uncharacterized membrane protein YoaK (UPF0700 family)
MVLLLSVVGGSVDAAMILGFGVLTAAQTGNTILLAVSLAQGELATGFYAAVSVVGYVIGAAVGELVILKRRDSADSWLSPAGWALLVELVPLGALLALWHGAGSHPQTAVIPALVVLAAMSVGIQSAAVLRLHVGPKTTYVTGTLTTFTTRAIQSLNFFETARARAHQQPSDHTWIYGASWLVYLGGAAAGALLFLKYRERALVLPLTAIVAVLLTEARRR